MKSYVFLFNMQITVEPRQAHNLVTYFLKNVDATSSHLGLSVVLQQAEFKHKWLFIAFEWEHTL